VSLIRSPLDQPLGEGTAESPRLVVDVWPAVPTADGWRVLLLKRTPRRGGFWQGVSGRVETFDASLEAAALREIREETGLAEGVEVFDLGRWVEFVGPRSGLRFRKRSLGAVLPAGTTPTSVRLSDEHLEVRLLPFAVAKSLVSFPVNVEELGILEGMLSGPRDPAAPARGA
jgi:8-oxo-dGTP pyrophosphatase MutT (NUDIX family)